MTVVGASHGRRGCSCLSSLASPPGGWSPKEEVPVRGNPGSSGPQALWELPDSGFSSTSHWLPSNRCGATVEAPGGWGRVLPALPQKTNLQCPSSWAFCLGRPISPWPGFPWVATKVPCCELTVAAWPVPSLVFPPHVYPHLPWGCWLTVAEAKKHSSGS